MTFADAVAAAAGIAGMTSDDAGVDSSQTPQLLMTIEGYAVAAVVLGVIGVVGFVCNLTVLIIFIKDRQLWTPLNGILMNLVASDFSISVMGSPLTFTAAVYRTWMFGKTMCVAYGFFMALLGICSITTLAALAFERYIVISRPWSGGVLTRRGGGLVLLGIWGYALAVTTPPLLGWGQYTNEAANISCSINWEKKGLNATSYIIFLFTFGLVIPVSIITVSYFNILRTMKKTTIQTGSVTRAEGRVALMVGVMISAFLIAWLPYAGLSLLVALGDASFVSPAMAVIPSIFAKSSICYNPFIYIALNTQFRAAWSRMLRPSQAQKSATFQTSGQVTCGTPPPVLGQPSDSEDLKDETGAEGAPDVTIVSRFFQPTAVLNNNFFIQVLVKMPRPTHWMGGVARHLRRAGGQKCCHENDDRKSLSSQNSSPEIVEVQVQMPEASEASQQHRSMEEAL